MLINNKMFERQISAGTLPRIHKQFIYFRNEFAQARGVASHSRIPIIRYHAIGHKLILFFRTSYIQVLVRISKSQTMHSGHCLMDPYISNKRKMHLG